MAVAAGEGVVGTSRVRGLEKRARQQADDPTATPARSADRAGGNEILKEALDLARPKKPPLRLSSWGEDGSR